MNPATKALPPNRRVLVVDADPAGSEEFRRILARGNAALDVAGGGKSGVSTATPAQGSMRTEIPFVVESALDLSEAWSMAEKARQRGKPYAVVFVDPQRLRVADVSTALRRLWEADPSAQLVILAASIDTSLQESLREVAPSDRWMIIRKPCGPVELTQVINVLTAKWNIGHMAAMRATTLEVMLEARRGEIEGVNRIKDEFLSNISHEMLTPLNGVSGMLELLALEDLPAEAAENLEVARGCAQSLHRLIQQILAFNDAAMGAFAADQKHGDPREWIEQLKQRYSDVAARRGVGIGTRVDEDVPRRVTAAESVLVKVLEALLDNAIKFSPQGGSVGIEVRWHPPPAARPLHFTVADSGAGLTPEQLTLIRTPFAQVDGASTRTSTGAGLGLPLARRLLSLVGSELQFSSKPGQGTRVSFSVPAEIVAEGGGEAGISGGAAA